jgi:hypothetical protein
MTVEFYDIDYVVFNQLSLGTDTLEQWKGKASGIADYIANWGLERFWAMSRRNVGLGGVQLGKNAPEDTQSYFSWGVARKVFCSIAGNNLGIREDMTTQQFQERLSQLNFHQQVMMSELLIEISEAIQFWTMRISDAQNNPV